MLLLHRRLQAPQQIVTLTLTIMDVTVKLDNTAKALRCHGMLSLPWASLRLHSHWVGSRLGAAQIHPCCDVSGADCSMLSKVLADLRASTCNLIVPQEDNFSITEGLGGVCTEGRAEQKHHLLRSHLQAHLTVLLSSD